MFNQPQKPINKSGSTQLSAAGSLLIYEGSPGAFGPPLKRSGLTHPSSARRDGCVSPETRRWRSGNGPLKLRQSSGDSLASIANLRKCDAANLAAVLAGRRNTPRLIAILEDHFAISIKELREVYREHYDRKKAGNPVAAEEIAEYHMYIRARRAAHKKGTSWKRELKKIRAAMSAINEAFASVPGIPGANKRRTAL